MSNYDEIVKLCRTCRSATALTVTTDYLCEKLGVVKHDHLCRKYKLNENLPRPKIRRTFDTAKFNLNDFQV